MPNQTTVTAPEENPIWKEIFAVYMANITNGFHIYGYINDAADMSRINYRNLFIKRALESGRIAVAYNRGNHIQIYPNTLEAIERFRAFAEFKSKKGSSTPVDPTAAAAKPSTNEPESADEMQRKMALAAELLAELNTSENLSAEAAMPMLERFIRNARQRKMVNNGSGKEVEMMMPAGIVLVEGAQTLAPASDWAQTSTQDRINVERLKNWVNSPSLVAAGNIIILITESKEDLHPALRSSKYESIEIPYPNFQQRLSTIENFVSNKAETSKPIVWEQGFTPTNLAAYTGGIPLNSVDDIMLRGHRSGMVTRAIARARKVDGFRNAFGDVLTFLDGDLSDDDMPGMEYLKLAFTENVIIPIQHQRWDLVMKGILLMGPPGTGKTRVVRWLGWKSGFEIVKLMFGGQIASKYVGEGERNLVKALRAIDSMGKVIVFVDEVDKAIPQGEGNNTQDIRLLQIFQEWSAGARESILVFATNYPSKIQDAFARAGRIDLRVLVPVPNDSERLPMLKYHFGTRNLRLTDAQLAFVNERTKGWTPAEIGEDLAPKAARQFLMGNMQKADSLTAYDAVIETLKTTRPSTTGVYEQTKEALAYVSDTRYLPPEYRQRFESTTGGSAETIAQQITDELESMRDGPRIAF